MFRVARYRPDPVRCQLPAAATLYWRCPLNLHENGKSMPSDLCLQGMQSDREYAAVLARSKWRQSRWAPSRIRMVGVPPSAGSI